MWLLCHNINLLYLSYVYEFWTRMCHNARKINTAMPQLFIKQNKYKIICKRTCWCKINRYEITMYLKFLVVKQNEHNASHLFSSQAWDVKWSLSSVSEAEWRRISERNGGELISSSNFITWHETNNSDTYNITSFVNLDNIHINMKKIRISSHG